MRFIRRWRRTLTLVVVVVVLVGYTIAMISAGCEIDRSWGRSRWECS